MMTSAGNTLFQVKTFGNLSITYNGKSLLGRGGVDSQFVSMLLILLHNPGGGKS